MRTALIAGGVGLAALAVVALQGCGRPPQIGPDEETFREVDALFTAVTARRPDLVDQCAQRLQTQRDRGKLPAKAHEELGRVIDRAKDGKWESAAERLYAFMQGQERPAASGERRPSGRR
jgi:hypothetical protein